jgi:lipid-A-disaccharide synthase
LIDADSTDSAVAKTSAAENAAPADAPCLMVCAGDLSGDQHAAKVLTALKRSIPNLQVFGVGGPALEAAGAELLFRAENLAIIGIVNVVRKLPLIAQVRARLLAEVEKRRPNCVMLVDYGGFNLSLAQSLHKKQPELPIVYFISPQVWGSRPWRMKVIARCVSTALVIFPFEEPLYRSRGIDAHFVGHPLTDRFASFDSAVARDTICQKLNLDANKPIVGIFPGSRSGEIKDFMPFLIQAVNWLRRDRPDLQFVMSQANPRIAELIYDGFQKSHALPVLGTTIKLSAPEDNATLMAASDLLWTKSGTTTLEAAMLQKPMLVFYRGDWLSFLLFLMFKRVKYVAWPNLLAGKRVVPELIQLDCRAEQLVRYTRDWLDVPGLRADVANELQAVKSYFQKGDFAANAARHLEDMLSTTPRQKIETKQ